jgi:endonuclease YncB( thermonuclease family)
MTEKGVVSVRLSGIDAPELRQKHGHSARRFLLGLVKGKSVDLKCSGRSYKRKTCEMYLGRIDIQAEMVKAGWAVDYRQYSKGKYSEFEKAARTEKKGIWADQNFVSPFCARHAKHKKCRSDKGYQP